MKRIGVFICHCGTNIAGVIDVQRVAEALRDYPGVVHSIDYKYMCSDPGQNLIREAITQYSLDGIVVAACSPTMHEATFRRAVASAGLNPYQCEIANIREQCSWVHQGDQANATAKAIEIIQTMVEKVRRNEDLEPLTMPLTKRALVIGGGIAGLQAALDIADGGHEVILVEREPALGGHMAHLSGTYLNFDSSPELLASRIDRVRSHRRIRTLVQSEVVDVNGYVGSFEVQIRTPNGDISEAVGAIVVATGYNLLPMSRLPEYGGGSVPDVIDGLQFEAMLAPEGPTGGKVERPSDGKVPQQVVWVQCAGSRDPEHNMPYCSKVCCMYVAKQAMMYKKQVPEGQAYVFYIDIRSAGKGYEEFVQCAQQEYGVLYLRGKVAKVFRDGDRVVVWGTDTLSGHNIEIAADLVVLATAVVPREDAFELGQRLRISTDAYGFFSEAHPKLRPVESLTAGIYLAGAAQAPRDIPETVAQASGAAAKVLSLFSHREIVAEPTVAYVAADLCAGCGICVTACPYEARSLNPVTQVAVVNAALCQGCGACVMACPNKACSIHNFAPEQILAMVEAVL